MIRTKEQIKLENKRLKAEYGDLFDSVADILFKHDPVGINFVDNTDEYYPEVRTILPRLRDCNSAQDVTSVVHEEFCKSRDRWNPLNCCFNQWVAGASLARLTTIATKELKLTHKRWS